MTFQLCSFGCNWSGRKLFNLCGERLHSSCPSMRRLWTCGWNSPVILNEWHSVFGGSGFVGWGEGSAILWTLCPQAARNGLTVKGLLWVCIRWSICTPIYQNDCDGLYSLLLFLHIRESRFCRSHLYPPVLSRSSKGVGKCLLKFKKWMILCWVSMK